MMPQTEIQTVTTNILPDMSRTKAIWKSRHRHLGIGIGIPIKYNFLHSVNNL